MFNISLQPIQAVDHLIFKNMINIVAHATDGVILPNCNATRHNIMNLFKTQMTNLKDQLNVSFCLSNYHQLILQIEQACT